MSMKQFCNGFRFNPSMIAERISRSRDRIVSKLDAGVGEGLSGARDKPHPNVAGKVLLAGVAKRAI
jgi:hypothetical protein